MATGRILIYGATGYTGKLVARESARRGLDVVLAGRDPRKLEAVASEHGFEARAFALDDAPRLHAALEDVAAVLHIAGPFSKTSRPMADACLATRTHYLERVTIEPSADAQRGASALRVLAQDRLRALPVLGAGTTGSETHSAYGPDGLIPGTERAERFLFWPMGIPSAGQMRQWGRHATAFVGRRHFDDAALFEKRFVLAVDEGVEPTPGPIAKPMRAPEPAAPH